MPKVYPRDVIVKGYKRKVKVLHTSFELRSGEETIEAFTQDKWTAMRWMKVGLPVEVQSLPGNMLWRVKLSSSGISGRLRWTQLMRLAVPKTWFEAPKDGRSLRHQPVRGNRAAVGARSESETRRRPTQAEGLRSILESLNEAAEASKREEGKLATLAAPVPAEPDDYFDAAMEDLEAYEPNPDEDGEV